VAKLPLITGIGLATPLGGSAPATWHGLLAGGFIRDHAQVRDLVSCDDLRINSLAVQVAREALHDARWSSTQRADAALIVGTSKGPAEAWLPRIDADEPIKLNAPSVAIPAGRSWNSFGLSDTATFVARSLGFINGPRLTLCGACASGLHALIHAAMLIRGGEVERALVVAAESSLHPLVIQSFRRLGVLAPPDIGCRPFDQRRAGFLMSEAAAAVCLEAVDADAIGARAASSQVMWVERYALAGDATHLTGSAADGRTLRRLLAHVIDDRTVDLVHAHGTGTEINDAIELAALEATLPSSDAGSVSLYSHKGALGHSLGAAGLVSIAINALAHRHSIVPPNVRTESPMKAKAVSIPDQASSRNIRRSLAIASGFGGSMAVVALCGLAGKR
jgi:3-oxoacyl-[acyl-carrier-protein] synthase II